MPLHTIAVEKVSCSFARNYPKVRKLCSFHWYHGIWYLNFEFLNSHHPPPPSFFFHLQSRLRPQSCKEIIIRICPNAVIQYACGAFFFWKNIRVICVVNTRFRRFIVDWRPGRFVANCVLMYTICAIHSKTLTRHLIRMAKIVIFSAT